MSYNFSEEKGAMTDTYKESVKFIHRALLYGISGFGTPANLLCFYILTRYQMKAKSSINCYLQFLAIFDGLFLFCWFLILNNIRDSWLYISMCMMATGSVYITVGVSLERFIAVCHPLRAKTLLTYRRTVLCNIFIVAFAICSNIPRISLSEETLGGLKMDFTLYYHMRFGSQADSVLSPNLKSDIYFVKCCVCLEIVVVYCIPQAAIAFLNICIYKAVRRAETTRQEISKSQKKEIKLSKTVFGIIIVFFACWTPVLIFKITSYCGILPLYVNYSMYRFCYPILSLNSAANVVIYCILRKDFRSTMPGIFCNRRNVHERNSAARTSV